MWMVYVITCLIHLFEVTQILQYKDYLLVKTLELLFQIRGNLNKYEAHH